eukprot:Sspe_Gene.58692::Locus_32198_Transcript_1_3_Confidence_0.600_Length_1414::g.58692::m.58692
MKGRPPNEDGFGTQTEGLEGLTASADPGVDEDISFHGTPHRIDDIGEHLQRRCGVGELPPSMRTDKDPFCPVGNRLLRVTNRHDALSDHRERRVLADPGEVLPRRHADVKVVRPVRGLHRDVALGLQEGWLRLILHSVVRVVHGHYYGAEPTHSLHFLEGIAEALLARVHVEVQPLRPGGLGHLLDRHVGVVEVVAVDAPHGADPLRRAQLPRLVSKLVEGRRGHPQRGDLLPVDLGGHIRNTKPCETLRLEVQPVKGRPRAVDHLAVVRIHPPVPFDVLLRLRHLSLRLLLILAEGGIEEAVLILDPTGIRRVHGEKGREGPNEVQR